MEEFLKHFKHHSRAEQLWLSELFEAVRQRLHPLIDSSLGLSVVRLSLAVVSKVQKAIGSDSLPVSYRLVSVSELTREQRSACCSSLSWSSAHYKERARGAELMLPEHKALPREHLLLIGFLCDGRASGTNDGLWRVRDAGGSVSCAMLRSSCLWLGRLMLFPTWNYIPQNAPAAGYLELTETPVCVTLEAMAFDPGGTLSEVMSVTRAADLLRQRCEDQVCVCVSGQVSAVCPLLLIRGKRFFCLILSDGGSSVPVFITEPKHQYWRQCVCVGQSVCLSSLRVCSLQGLDGRCVLSDSCQSRLHLQEISEDPDTHTHTDAAHTHIDDTHTDAVHTHTHTDDTHTHLPSGSASAVRVKRSTLINFKGTVTKVLNAEAGLYEMDRQVGLCLAYQPAQQWGGGLRPGAEIQLHNVHFLYQACRFSPRVVLCVCLRSSVQITAFSFSSPLQESGSHTLSHTHTHSALQRLLLEKNLGVSQYLWLCYCQNAVTERLCPRWVRPERVCVVAGRLLDFVCGAEQKRQKKRDIYREMIQEPHQCPVTTYCVSWPAVALWSLRQLCEWMRCEVWSLSLLSLLPAAGSHLTAPELRAHLSWSSLLLPLPRAPEPLLLLGVLELDSTRATLQLRDLTHTLDCVCVQTGQSGALDTAWQGCLVCVRRCTLVMERFMKTNFPSWKHLDQPSYITHKHCRVYLQLCVDDLTIISPSSAMSLRLSDPTEQPERPLTPVPCVSLLLRLEVKQGVSLRNGFVTRAVTLGDVQIWGHDPKNRKIEERERQGEQRKIELHIMGPCVRWFPVLHPGWVYRLIALKTEDVSVLKAKEISARGGVTQLSSPALLLQPQWRIHTLTDELPDAQSGVPALMTVSEVLHSSSAPEIVSFYGVLSERITLLEDSGTTPNIQSVTAAKDEGVAEELRVRLTLQDADWPAQMVQLYYDLSGSPYTHGLISGASLQLHQVQRKVSRSGASQPPPPMMLLGEWASARTQRGVVGQVKGHVVRVLTLRLQWTCSLCGSIFTQTSCGRTHPPCDSTSAVFQAEAKVAVEDGSADAHVFFSSDTVCDLLMLNVGQWEGLQRLVRVKGHVKVYTRGYNMTCDEYPDDALVQYLNCVCSSTAVCRRIHLTCRIRAQRTGKPQLRKVHRGQTEFICKFTPALQLQCQHIHTH
ncbi:CST complex subunit CTC1 isoform X2 [Pseudorasbora parva]|uniref:CST complex subunit CTC1 isoform X2 n=1 Tax=Pseudorasbora parva TaxID=51549 RepID=UPI00351DC44A